MKGAKSWLRLLHLIAHQDCTSNKPLAVIRKPARGNQEEALPGDSRQEWTASATAPMHAFWHSFRRQSSVKIGVLNVRKRAEFDLQALFVDDMQTDYPGNSLNYISV